MAGLIAHEWIAQHGGSENVAESMGRAFPDADVVTLWNDAPERLRGHKVTETWLSKTPLRRNKAAALPFMSSTWRNVDTSPYDFVLASSHVFAHHVPVDRETPKFVYAHTPARTIWAPEQDSRGANVVVRASAPFFRRLDRSRVDDNARYAANSNYIKERIASTWDQDATVIYPPVDVTGIRSAAPTLDGRERRLLDGLPSDFVLGASRFVPYKRLDLVIEAGSAAGIPVVLAGGGPLREALEAKAADSRVPVVFIDQPSNGLLHELYRRASVFLFPPVEDFGIMPVEAMAAGTPVVTYAVGGASESVEIVRGGVVSASLDPGELGSALLSAVDTDMRDVPQRVERSFGEDAFITRLRDWMSEK
ncbi:glycosyltransferase [Curtobacterium sp. NPDC088465]|uniref:glycosyltransferase n=1 Tax=Curtobacterium sp. NPDC088465 TaxID=3363967 RepID=UPI00381821BC